MKEECTSLKTKKEQADASSIKAKSLVTRLNKEISSQKASIGAFKAALEKTKKEKGESANSNIRANNKIAEAQVSAPYRKHFIIIRMINSCLNTDLN